MGCKIVEIYQEKYDLNFFGIKLAYDQMEMFFSKINIPYIISIKINSFNLHSSINDIYTKTLYEQNTKIIHP